MKGSYLGKRTNNFLKLVSKSVYLLHVSYTSSKSVKQFVFAEDLVRNLRKFKTIISNF